MSYLSSTLSLVPVILSGGLGSRLWPVSRETCPKPFIKLPDGQNFLQKTFLRAVSLTGVKEILTVTQRELFFKTQDEFHPINTAPVSTSYILEPFPRNTAAAVAAAALQAKSRHGEEAILLILPADHLIADTSAFNTAITQAIPLAQQGRLVTFGVPPSAPQTAYGYIEADGHTVKSFVEKPSLAMAKSFMESGRFLWNAGIFCFTAKTVLEELRQHAPKLLDAVEVCLSASRLVQGKDFWQMDLDPRRFDAVPNISIDYALMEKSSRLAVVPCAMGWSDIGSWTALSDLIDADENGNRIDGKAILHDVAHCYIRSDGRIVGAVGLKDVVIIDTPEALLVADKSRAQDIKNLYIELKARGLG